MGASGTRKPSEQSPTCIGPGVHREKIPVELCGEEVKVGCRTSTFPQAVQGPSAGWFLNFSWCSALRATSFNFISRIGSVLISGAIGNDGLSRLLAKILSGTYHYVSYDVWSRIARFNTQCESPLKRRGVHQENPESAWMELEVLPLEKIAWSSAILFEVHEIASVVDCQHGALGTVVFSAKVLGIPWKRSEALPSHRGGSVVCFFACPFHA